MRDKILDYLPLGVFSLNVLLGLYLLWPQASSMVAFSPHPSVVALEKPLTEAPALIAEGGDSYALVAPTLENGVSPKVFKRFRVKSGQSSHPSKAAFHGVLNVNTASLTELQKLPGIGPKMALRIVAYRKAHGPFVALADLGNVEGIGPKKLAKLAPFCKF